MNEVDERWKDFDLCDICGGKSDNMTNDDTFIAGRGYPFYYCLHHTDEEINNLFKQALEDMKIERENKNVS
jgi:hypothetical protein